MQSRQKQRWEEKEQQRWEEEQQPLHIGGASGSLLGASLSSGSMRGSLPAISELENPVERLRELLLDNAAGTSPGGDDHPEALKGAKGKSKGKKDKKKGDKGKGKGDECKGHPAANVAPASPAPAPPARRN